MGGGGGQGGTAFSSSYRYVGKIECLRKRDSTAGIFHIGSKKLLFSLLVTTGLR